MTFKGWLEIFESDMDDIVLDGMELRAAQAAWDAATKEERALCAQLARDMFNAAATGDEIADAIILRGNK